MSEIVFRFEGFQVDRQRALLTRDGEAVALEPRAFALLIYLLEHRERLVTREELLDDVWAGAFVTANALSRAIARLRKALGDDPRAPRIVETVPTRGFRFVASVTEVSTGPPRSAPVAVEKAVGAGQRSARRFAVLVILVVIAITVVALGRRPTVEPDATARLAPRRLAVLPLATIGDDDAYLAVGLTEQLISSLARVDGLRVIARTSAMTYRSSDKRIDDIARELGVDSVIEGSVRRDEERLRIAIRLVEATTEVPVWARDFEGRLGDVFAFQARDRGRGCRGVGGDDRTGGSRRDRARSDAGNHRVRSLPPKGGASIASEAAGASKAPSSPSSKRFSSIRTSRSPRRVWPTHTRCTGFVTAAVTKPWPAPSGPSSG